MAHHSTKEARNQPRVGGSIKPQFFSKHLCCKIMVPGQVSGVNKLAAKILLENCLKSTPAARLSMFHCKEIRQF